MPKIKLLSSVTLDQKTTSPDLLTLLLRNRKVKPADQSFFLKPPHPKNLTPKDIKLSTANLKKAVKRIKTAIKNKEKILIYGDYDVDGLTATTIIWEVLQKKGGQVKSFVPHREKDGYGLNQKSLERIFKNYKPDLLITVDNGIVAHQAASFLKKEKIDLIITDHHLSEKKLPPALSIVHSSLVCGAVVAWFLAREIGPADYGLAGLGTVADCLPLLSVNRSFVYHGLDSLTHTQRPGLNALKQTTSLGQKKLSAYDLGFILGPRLNAAGRVGDPGNSLRLLASPDSTTAGTYARLLEKQNRERQNEQSTGQTLARSIYEKEKDPDIPLIFLSSPDFNPGTIGLIAGRLSQEHYRPTVIISEITPIAKASCRSVPELDILEALRKANKGLLVDLGGHSTAAGFSILPKNIKKFKKALQTIIKKMVKGKKLEPQVKADALAKISLINLKNYQTIQKLQPFGIGNPEPSFYFKNLKVIDKQLLGRDKNHLKLLLDDPDTPKTESIPLESLSFWQAESYQDLKVGDIIDLVAKISLNEFRGRKKLQLINSHLHVKK